MQGILIRSSSIGGVAEEAPGADKDENLESRSAAEQAGLAGRVARLRPLDLHQGIGGRAPP